MSQEAAKLWGPALRVLRHSRKVSGQEMARRLDVDRSRVYQIESDTASVQRDTVTEYLEAIDATMLELATIHDGFFDVLLVKEAAMMRGVLRWGHGVELYDDDGDKAQEYTSIPAMIDAIEEAGWDLYLKLEN
jgi:transcriptional regulator with XRE-family HTH domain